MIRTISRAQSWFEASCYGAGHALDLLLRSIFTMHKMGKRWKETYYQTYNAIFGAMPVVFLTALFTGMILGLQAGLTLKAGCGIGYEFSTLRPRGAYVSGAGAKTSGPLSFMDIFDRIGQLAPTPIFRTVNDRAISFNHRFVALNHSRDLF